jgi:UDP-3-O-[3-hydroxymyristoyl] glucosamine N-acyltransferase
MMLAQLIDALGGKLLHGNAQTEIRAVNASDRAAAGDLVFAEDAAAAAEALESAASALVLKAGLPQAAVSASDPGCACTTAIVKTTSRVSGLRVPPNCSRRRSRS